MGLFDRLFGTSKKEKQPDVRFGRYSDSYKAKENYKNWDLAIEKFEAGDPLAAYEAFFAYLADPSEQNVSFERKEDAIHFEILQGSKKVTGVATAEKVTAESVIVKCDSLNVGFMRQLLEKNYLLRHSRLALANNDDALIKFDTSALDGSPYKLYYALKEVATNADKQDDLLLDKFPMVHPVNNSHIKELAAPEKEVKFNYLTQQIKQTLDYVNSGKLDKDKYAGGMAYLWLGLTYKLDYLLKPEGAVMEMLEKNHHSYFAKDNKPPREKNIFIQKNFEKILERSKEEVFKELYRVTSTFGITSSTNHERIQGMIDHELPNMDWYKDNGHDEIALSVPGYIAGYSTFYYAVPQPVRELFHLFYEITEPEFFSALGFTFNYYDPVKKKLDKGEIKDEIKDIVKSNREQFPDLNPDMGTLNFDSLVEFAKSYMIMIRNMKVIKAS